MHKLILIALGSSVGIAQALPPVETSAEFESSVVLDQALVNGWFPVVTHELNKNDSVSNQPLISIPLGRMKLQWQQAYQDEVGWVFCLTSPVQGLEPDHVAVCGVDEHRYFYNFFPARLSGEREYYFGKGALDGSCSYLKAGGVTRSLASSQGLTAMQEIEGSWVQLLVTHTELKLSSENQWSMNGIYTMGLGSWLASCCGCVGSSAQDEGQGNRQQENGENSNPQQTGPGNTNPGGDKDPPWQPSSNDEPQAVVTLDQSIVDMLKRLIQFGRVGRLIQSLSTVSPMTGTAININPALQGWAQTHNVDLQGTLQEQWQALFDGLQEHQDDIGAFAIAAQQIRPFKSMLQNAGHQDSRRHRQH